LLARIAKSRLKPGELRCNSLDLAIQRS